MASRTLRTNLVLSLTFVVAACNGDETPADATTFTGADEVDGTADATSMDDEVDESGSASDSSTGDGDGDPTTSDDNVDGTETIGTTDDTTDSTDDSMECLDLDQDGYGDNCEMGPDCDDADYNNHTDMGCANCQDMDLDGNWVGCDIFDEAKPGPDCDDMDFNVFSQDGCDNCSDMDGDNYWVGCDQYGNEKPGPDCDDDNPVVGIDDAVEICNGLAENCAMEVDNQPPDDMCPTNGMDPPNVNPMGGWICDPPAPGVDGCQIAACVEQFFDLDAQIPNGCECGGTPRTESLAACSGAPQGYLGDAGEGEQIIDLVVGTVPLIDNGIGSGNEDWYSVDFPPGGNPGVRPNTGSIRVDFEQNDGLDYRFAVHRTCNGVAFDQGLATQFGAGAPPVREWWFFDNHTAAVNMPVPALYNDMVSWPNTVYIRVFRVQNDKTCNHYKLRIQRVAN